jgi:hypothetical protein
MKALSLFIILLVSVTYGLAQDIASSHLRWTVNQLTDLNTGKVQSYSATFETNGTQSIQWIQKNGSNASQLAVQNLTGSWTNILNNGQVMYTILWEDLPGTLQIERSNAGMTITIDVGLENGKRMHNTYTVSAVNPIN